MESGRGIKDAVLLLDNYGEESAMLHQSFRQAGFDGPVIVVEDDGFFPADVISAYQYFCGDFAAAGGPTGGKPRYFNQIQVPDYWEISGTGMGGKVQDLSRERGRIFYAEPKQKRLVKVVDWLDEKGMARVSDHYNRCGALYARTFFSKDAKRFCKAYFDPDGREVLVENYVTHDITLNRNGKVYILRSKTELVVKLLEELGAAGGRIFYNSLSTPFFVSERLAVDGPKRDVLFWQEGARDDIPGNMQIILDGRSVRTGRIYVQKRASYEKLLALGASEQVVKPLGFAYEFTRQNTCGNQALICTNSDRIEGLEQLVKELPGLHFHIAAVTEMSSKLTAMSQYGNVSLYPGIRPGLAEELFGTCDYYLDINYEGEILSAVKQAFSHNQLIVGFDRTLHNPGLTAPEHVFRRTEDMIAFLRATMGSGQAVELQLNLQRQAAMAESPAAYANLLKQ